MSQIYIPESIDNHVLETPSFSRRQFLGSITGITAMIGLYGCVSTPTKPSDPPIRLTEGMPNTLTYVNENGQKETVTDLRGMWNLYITESGGHYSQEAKIEQEKNKFIGTKTRGGIIVTDEFLRGILEPNYSAFRELIKNGPPWEAVKGTISSDLNIITYQSSMAAVSLHRIKI